MIVLVNGEETELADGLSVKGLVERLGLDPARLAVEVNRKIIRKAEWGSTSLSDGDKVEIVHFVGGGSGRAD
ncbi:MAG TPA: sulfur carrier protein ThiS [Blastocatellia bacterium]|nr:sulfur carrier protein ThiS [Blastocatellia bacterium]